MVFALVIGITGGVLAAAQFYHIDPEVFLESVRSLLKLSDLFMVLVKGLIFGAIVAINGCSWGLTTKGGVKEVGESATTAVVTTWVLIFMGDFLLSLLMFQQPLL